MANFGISEVCEDVGDAVEDAGRWRLFFCLGILDGEFCSSAAMANTATDDTEFDDTESDDTEFDDAKSIG